MPKFTIDFEVSQETYDRLQRTDKVVMRALTEALKDQLDAIVNGVDFRETIDAYKPEELIERTQAMALNKLREIITAMGGELITTGELNKDLSMGAGVTAAHMTDKNVAIIQKIANGEMTVAELVSRYETGTLDYDEISPKNIVKVASDVTPSELERVVTAMKNLGVDAIGLQHGAAFRAKSIPEPYRQLIIDFTAGKLTMAQVLDELDKVQPTNFADAELPTHLS